MCMSPNKRLEPTNLRLVSRALPTEETGLLYGEGIDMFPVSGPPGLIFPIVR